LETNLLALLVGSQAAVKAMRACKANGHVVNISSIAAQRSDPGVYGATKHAVVSMSESLYRDFKRRNTRLGVTCLIPDVTNTRMIDAVRNRPPEFANPNEVARTPEEQARVAAWAAAGKQPEEVAEMVLQAIRNNQLYLLTHDAQDERVEDRMRAILGRSAFTFIERPARTPPPGWQFEEKN
ncbi:MAG TPA: SDR family NAD(P)-dependent oxidoreductase, partial [Dehalococcoidia bacterium]|nr:SDR family NAD(P)-dependent oxidoreductase [Dehalococcoidia bacterium]